MKRYYSMYMGMCVGNNDPEKRGRVQIFVPNIMPALWDEWNQDVAGSIDSSNEKDPTSKTFDSVGANIPSALSPSLVTKLRKILPWAEAASPVFGMSSPGYLTDEYDENYQEDQQKPVDKRPEVAKVLDQSPVGLAPVKPPKHGASEITSMAGEQAASNPHQNVYGAPTDPSVYNKVNPFPRDELNLEKPKPPFTSMVHNTSPHGALATQVLNNTAKGVFSFPAVGAVLWVFFREGNPLYPVYFAASYGSKEWQSAYRILVDEDGTPEGAPGYKPDPIQSDPDKNIKENPFTSAGGLMNLGGVGGIRWEDTNDYYGRASDHHSITFFGRDGSNIHFDQGYSQFFSKFDRRDQVEGDRWTTTLGFKEEWTQGDSNDVTMGDVYVKVGDVSEGALNTVLRIQEIIKQCQMPLTANNPLTDQ